MLVMAMKCANNTEMALNGLDLQYFRITPVAAQLGEERFSYPHPWLGSTSYSVLVCLSRTSRKCKVVSNRHKMRATNINFESASSTKRTSILLLPHNRETQILIAAFHFIQSDTASLLVILHKPLLQTCLSL